MSQNENRISIETLLQKIGLLAVENDMLRKRIAELEATLVAQKEEKNED